MSTDNVAKGTAGTGSVAKKLDIEEASQMSEYSRHAASQTTLQSHGLPRHPG